MSQFIPSDPISEVSGHIGNAHCNSFITAKDFEALKKFLNVEVIHRNWFTDSWD